MICIERELRQGVTALITAVITDTIAALTGRLADRCAGLRITLQTATAIGALANT
jgi:hypothetical protein